MPRPSILSTLREYSEPVLVSNKEFYIQYYVRNPFTGQSVRKRIRLNRLKGTKQQRTKEANRIRKALSNKLEHGWNPFLEADNPKSFTKISEVIDMFFKIKRDLRPDTIRSYRSYLKILHAFIMDRYKEDLFAAQLDRSKAVAFMNHIFINMQVSNRTYNNYLLTMRTFFNWMIEQHYIYDNPFKSIRTKHKEIKNRMYINDQQRIRIKQYLECNNVKFLFIVLFSYYTLLRRKEITFVKIENIDLNKGLLYVKGEWTKNKQNQYVTIPDPVIKCLTDIGIKDFPSDYYLFSADLLPGKIQLAPKKISDLWAKMRKELKLNKNIQFMSLRDTGIRNLLRSGITIDDVSKHARHSSIEVTKTYLFHDEVKPMQKIKRFDQF